MVARPRRLLITGSPGSGKTHLASVLSRALGVPHIELDALHHGPDWTPADPQAFRATVNALIEGPGWIVDGNYNGKLGELVRNHTDLIVALDLPRPVVFLRLVRRTLSRVVRRTELWNGNREDWRNLISTDESSNLLLWAHRHFGRYRERATHDERESRRSGPPAVRLRTRGQVVRFTGYMAARGR